MQNDLLQTGYQVVGCIKKHTTGKTFGSSTQPQIQRRPVAKREQTPTT
ncbi:hypothetical protein CCHR01_19220, partial [Colletotrichum chrysophilum]